MLPAGIGITEGSFGSLLSLTGIEISFAVVLGIVIRLFTLWFGVGIGFIALKLSKSLWIFYLSRRGIFFDFRIRRWGIN